MIYDAIISGAGPAGCKCAETLALNGFEVALIEKKTTWRKPCGGAVSSRVMEKYFPQIRKLNPIIKTGAFMFSADYHQLEYNWEGYGENSIVVDRLEFDNLLKEVAINAGAHFFNDNLSYDFIIKNKKKIGIKTRSPLGIEEYLGKIIIIADGMSSKLAVRSGLRERWKINDIALAKCSIIEGESNLDIKKLHIYFRPYKGYGWIFPIDERRTNIGCGTFEEDNLNYNLNTIYDEFLNNPHIKNYFSGSRIKTLWTGSFPMSAKGVVEKSLYGDNIMMIGDAAGFVSPISGEGIHPSIVSGQVAAETAVYALEKEDISKNTLRSYKTHYNIKKIIKNFKLKRSLVEFFYEQGGKNLNNMFNLAEKDENFKTQVINMFFFNATPSQEFFSKIRNFV
jgi:geranylgeranyl reductase family protein